MVLATFQMLNSGLWLVVANWTGEIQNIYIINKNSIE